MIVSTLLLAITLAIQAETAAETVILKDGASISGQILSMPVIGKGSQQKGGSKGVQPIQLLVRRGWAEAHLKEKLAQWDQANEPISTRAAKVQRERLVRWRREREPGLPETERRNDRILNWIDQRLERLDSQGWSRSPLMIVRLSRNEIRSLGQKPAKVSRLLALAWLNDLPDPEAMPAEALRKSLEERCVNIDVSRPVNLDRLFPPLSENDGEWLARRAATEVSVDSNLRFVRCQNLVLPDTGGPQALDQAMLNSGLSELKKLLDSDENTTDPLVERLEKIEASGHVGSVVTRLTIPPDLSAASVEVTLWARVGPRRWLPVAVRTATIRPDDLPAELGDAIAEDPQVKSIFRAVEALGLGQAVQDLKQRSLRFGAATQKALDSARSTFQADLDALALPIFDPEQSRKDAKGSTPANELENGQPRE